MGRNIHIWGSHYYTVKPWTKISKPWDTTYRGKSNKTTIKIFEKDTLTKVSDEKITVEQAIYSLLNNKFWGNFLHHYKPKQYTTVVEDHNHIVNALLSFLQDIEHQELITQEQKKEFETRLHKLEIPQNHYIEIQREIPQKIIESANQTKDALKKIVFMGEASTKDISIQPKNTNLFEVFEKTNVSNSASISRYQSLYILKIEQLLKSLSCQNTSWAKNIPQETKDDCINQLKQITVFKDIKAFRTQEKWENAISIQLNTIQEKLMKYSKCNVNEN